METTRVVAPLAAAGANWAVRKGMNSAYQKRTGSETTIGKDVDRPFRQVLLWTIGTAVAISVIDLLIQRWIARTEQQSIEAS